MKRYLLGFGAMLVGAGLMFVFTHTEVSAYITGMSEAEIDFKCEDQILGKLRENPKDRKMFGKYKKMSKILECKKGKTTCYLYRHSYGDNAMAGGLSCINSGIFK
jgi:hypothetical protein